MDAQGVGLDLAGGGGSDVIVGAAMHVDTHFRIVEYGAMIAVAQQWVTHYQASGASAGQVDVVEGW
jgi:hypothetical protein